MRDLLRGDLIKILISIAKVAKFQSLEENGSCFAYDSTIELDLY